MILFVILAVMFIISITLFLCSDKMAKTVGKILFRVASVILFIIGLFFFLCASIFRGGSSAGLNGLYALGFYVSLAIMIVAFKVIRI